MFALCEKMLNHGVAWPRTSSRLSIESLRFSTLKVVWTLRVSFFVMGKVATCAALAGPALPMSTFVASTRKFVTHRELLKSAIVNVSSLSNSISITPWPSVFTMYRRWPSRSTNTTALFTFVTGTFKNDSTALPNVMIFI